MNSKISIRCRMAARFLCQLALLVAPCNVIADDTSVSSSGMAMPIDCGIVVTCRPTPASVFENGTYVVKAQVPPCTMLELHRPPTDCRECAERYWPVWIPVPGMSPMPGLIPRESAFSIEEMRQRVLTMLPGGLIPDDPATDRAVPRVVTVSGKTAVKAWKRVFPLATVNSTLPKEKRSPEPHLALAHLWVAVGSHPDALIEYVKGAELVRAQQKGDLLEYARYFTVLEESLQRATKQPGALFVADARKYWGAGMNQFRLGRLDLSIVNFTDAVRLDPSDPMAWYARAICYRTLKFDEEAERDARIGVTVERRLPKYKSTEIGKSLEYFQGSTRIWLEGFRSGDGISWGRFRSPDDH